jgi:hypothetical protein
MRSIGEEGAICLSLLTASWIGSLDVCRFWVLIFGAKVVLFQLKLAIVLRIRRYMFILIENQITRKHKKAAF